MFQVEHSTFVNCPPQAAFEIFAYPEGRMKWGSAKSEEWVTEEPHGVGSELRSVTKFLGRNMDAVSKVTVWEPSKRLVTVVDGSVSAEVDHRFEERDGGTQVTITGNLELGSLFKIGEPLLKRQVDKTMEADLGQIKLILENETA